MEKVRNKADGCWLRIPFTLSSRKVKAVGEGEEGVWRGVREHLGTVVQEPDRDLQTQWW